ncbi:MAG: hypothetical protein HFH31_04550 [Bacilli bacterium]|nr:hypothetical protein [Bacilli bacterium]
MDLESMPKLNQCIDFYGEKLKVGDEVIPMLEEALIIGIGGVVSKISYSEEYNNYYITITDKEGNILLENIDARCYTIQERYEAKENQKYVYSLTFYNERFCPITFIPLTNKTDLDYEIPSGTSFITIDAQHLQKKGEQLTENSWSCPIYTLSKVYHFIVDGKGQLYHDETNDNYCLVNSETDGWHPINSDYRVFKDEEEIRKYVKGIIAYFKDADLAHINNNEEFDKNEFGKDFEKRLVTKLQH